MANKISFGVMDLARKFRVDKQTVYNWSKNGTLEKKGFTRSEKFPGKYFELGNEQVQPELDLKEKHLEVKIQKDQQQLYGQRLLFAEKISDTINEYFIVPKFAQLSEIIKIENKTDRAKEWNKAIENGSNESWKELQQELQRIILE